jgi:hypothetical protein
MEVHAKQIAHPAEVFSDVVGTFPTASKSKHAQTRKEWVEYLFRSAVVIPRHSIFNLSLIRVATQLAVMYMGGVSLVR